MRKKTEGLTFPTDPLASYRAMQDLDAVPPPAPPTQPAADEASDQAETASRDVDSNIDSSQPSNIATPLDDEQDSYAASNVARRQDSKLDGHRRHDGSEAQSIPKERGKARKQPGEKANKIDSYVASMLDSPLSQLNIRVPSGMNDWLDEYAHRHRKQKVTKQSLVTQAIEEMIRRFETEEADS